jgi:homoserine dehydrogenase
MRPVTAALIGLGNVGQGALRILTENAGQIEQKLGSPLRVKTVCSRKVHALDLPFTGVRTADWQEVVADPEIDVVAELIGGTGVARAVVEAAISRGKSVVTANKELMALAGVELWAQAAARQVHLAMEASVAGGIPVHGVLRDGIAADRVTALFGILNGTCNYILTEIESRNAAFDAVLAEAQRLGYAEADPSADIDGLDARSKLAILAGLAFGQRVAPAEIYTEGIRRITPIDFAYAHQLRHTIRLVCSARTTDNGLLLQVRPALLPQATILASVQGAYNAVWVRGVYGADTFYYGRGAGPHPTGVAVVSDLMRIARDLAAGVPPRESPFGFRELAPYAATPVEQARSAYYLRFRVADRPGIIAQLATVLAEHSISIDAVLQLPVEDWRDLPFVITVEPTTEAAIRAALARMAPLDFLLEPPLALPMEKSL